MSVSRTILPAAAVLLLFFVAWGCDSGDPVERISPEDVAGKYDFTAFTFEPDAQAIAPLDLLDTPPVQRLRHVKQLSTVRLVYPSANHTRFEHSLGVYHLADRAVANLAVTEGQAERVRAAALLHDVIEDTDVTIDQLRQEGLVREVDLRLHDR